RAMLRAPIVDETEGARVGILAYGSSDMAVREARHLLDTQENIQTSYLRMRALPLNGEVEDFLAMHDVVYVVEQNRDGQMATILRSELPESASKLKSVLHYDGLPIHAQTIIDQILDYELQ
ncbi:MAG: 2-oxoacid:acceptor oxidoreductase subunit alpha, partial [Candidatus Hydrogenedentes bacterium]|nr:2-oxoacid:acceptor oxidoreductase subunit alpha [Candidatus Hydrogenedentota bacterium]